MKNLLLAVIGMATLTSAPVLANGEPREPQAAKAEFAYKPFPTIPVAEVRRNEFVTNLIDTCERLVVLDAPEARRPEAPRARGTARETPPPSEEELGVEFNRVWQQATTLSDSTESVAGVGVVRDGPVPLAPQPAAEVSSEVRDFESAVRRLDGVCSKLLQMGPAKSLDDADLDVLRAARDAPELLDTYTKWGPQPLGKAARSAASARGIMPASPSFAVLSDKLIRGMGEFLVKRGEEEARSYLRTVVHANLCTGEVNEPALRKAVFSHTCAALTSLDDGTPLDAIGAYLRTAAEQDLRRMPDVLLAYTGEREPTTANLTYSGRLGIAYFGAVRSGRDPLEVVYSIGDLPRLPCEVNDCLQAARAVRVVSAVTFALRQGGENWSRQLREIIQEPKHHAIAFVALSLLAEARLEAAGQPSFTFDVKRIDSAMRMPLPMFTALVTLGEDWTALARRLDSDLPEEERRQVIADAMERATDNFAALLEHAGAIDDADDLTLQNISRRIRGFGRIASSLVRRDYPAAAILTLREGEDASEKLKLPTPLKKYLPLLVEIASAQSSNEVAAAIDAFAAPLATYRRKYQDTVFGLNGFLGVTAGWERMDSKGLRSTALAAAVSAPIGVHVTTPVSDSFHIGLLATLLDLGAITSVKLDDKEPEGELTGANDDAAAPVESDVARIGFAQVFSPGAYLTLGLAGSPVVFGAGVNFAPELREVTQGADKAGVSVLRFGGFLGIDVPILPFN